VACGKLETLMQHGAIGCEICIFQLCRASAYPYVYR
jgi:hypothetical protein